MSQPEIDSLTARIDAMKTKHGITDEDIRLAQKWQAYQRFAEAFIASAPKFEQAAARLAEVSKKAGVSFAQFAALE